MEQSVSTIGAGRKRLLIHDVTWYCEVLSENIQISMFVDKLLDIMEKMNKKKDGNYDLREFDAHMEEMPKIKHEDKVKKMLINGQKNLHVHGEKAYDALYAELNNLLQELGNAEFLFADNTMKYCGETEKDMFHEKQEEEDD